MVVGAGPFATICREPRQVRKEATVVTDSCAEMWLVSTASNFCSDLCKSFQLACHPHVNVGIFQKVLANARMAGRNQESLV